MTKKRNVLQVEGLNNEFEREGYVVFENAFSPEKIESFRTRMQALSPSDNFNANQKTLIPEQSYHCTFFDQDKGYRGEVRELMTEFFSEFIEEHFADYKIIQANIFIKPAHSGYVYPHQNLTVVDEEKFSSVSLWCPLQDTGVKNGTMQLVPGTHNKFEKYRNADIYWPLLEIFEGEGKNLLKSLEVSKGTVVALDDSIIHGTPVNETDEPRVVFHTMLIPKEASAIFCDLNQETDMVRTYEVSDEFWQYQIPGFKPTLENPVKTEVYQRNSYRFDAQKQEIEQVGK